MSSHSWTRGSRLLWALAAGAIGAWVFWWIGGANGYPEAAENPEAIAEAGVAGPVPGLGTGGQNAGTAGASGSPARQRMAGCATIRGRTLLHDGRALAGVLVRSVAGSSTQSDGLGNFVLSGLEPGAHQLQAEVPGFVSLPSARIGLAEDETVEDVILTLDRAHLVTGSVVSTRGEPLPGARVSGRVCAIDVWPDLPEGALGEATTVVSETDLHGSFRLGPLPPGRVEVTVELAGYLPFARIYQSDAANLQLALEAGASVSGLVLDPEGRDPVVLARVLLLISANGPQAWRLAAEVVPEASDAAAGRFRMPVASSREMKVIAVPRDYAPAVSLPFQVARGTTHHLELRARVAGHLRGRVHDETGAPLAGAEVSIREAGAAYDALRTASTAEGTFRLGPLAPGRFLVRIVRTGCFPCSRQVELTGTSTPALLDIEVARGASLSGSILGLRGVVTPSLQVTAVRSDDREAVPQVANVLAGGYSFACLTPGAYSVTLREAGVASESTPVEPVQLARGEARTLDLDSGRFGLARFLGVVTRNGSPQPFTAVRLLRDRKPAVAFTTTDHRGRFEFDGLAAGTAEVVVTLGTTGPLLVRRSVLVGTSGDLEETFEVATGSVSGRVLDGRDHRPVSGVRIAACGEAGVVLASCISDEGGCFRLPVVLAGKCSLTFARLGSQEARQVPVTVPCAQRVVLVDTDL